MLVACFKSYFPRRNKKVTVGPRKEDVGCVTVPPVLSMMSVWVGTGAGEGWVPTSLLHTICQLLGPVSSPWATLSPLPGLAGGGGSGWPLWRAVPYTPAVCLVDLGAELEQLGWWCPDLSGGSATACCLVRALLWATWGLRPPAICNTRPILS